MTIRNSNLLFAGVHEEEIAYNELENPRFVVVGLWFYPVAGVCFFWIRQKSLGPDLWQKLKPGH
ncbi:hypothetical protein C900_02281 [Fulvivirga imtechensis AK7]|uniref:Uncharacterized protein n=1 Tax=Fulvivirga imtechensis AK7 TaxID=1237149 RepID=L8JRW1_9BACT|nr:hypothetical protein [Fulvivirga imtechensis]ELR71696.1 hypothetical protein C900_02281 [Fulvivirga imtechensis AK7]